jgi:hypothetical protein
MQANIYVYVYDHKQICICVFKLRGTLKANIDTLNKYSYMEN